MYGSAEYVACGAPHDGGATGALWQEPPLLNQWKQPLELTVMAATAAKIISLFMNRTSRINSASSRG